MPIQPRTSQEILARIKERLAEVQLDTSDSSLTVLFSKIISDIMAEQSEQVAEAYRQAHLYSAEGEGLDRIGQEKNVPRLPGESDENYRYRLAQAELALYGDNPEAIRQALLKVDGIKEVVLVPYTFGAGSGTVLLVAHDPYAGEELIQQANAVLRSVSPWGNRIVAALPQPRALGMEIQLELAGEMTEQERTLLREQVRLVILEYLTSILPETMIISGLMARILEVTREGL